MGVAFEPGVVPKEPTPPQAPLRRRLSRQLTLKRVSERNVEGEDDDEKPKPPAPPGRQLTRKLSSFLGVTSKESASSKDASSGDTVSKGASSASDAEAVTRRRTIDKLHSSGKFLLGEKKGSISLRGQAERKATLV